MDTETSPFETSETVATFLATTPLLTDSWRLCEIANKGAPGSFLTEQIGNIGYIAFSAVQTVSRPGLVALDSATAQEVFSPLYPRNAAEEEEPVMVHAGMLDIFLSTYQSPDFCSQMRSIMEKSKSIVITGHSIGGATASLTALWLLSHLHLHHSSIPSPFQVLCITFGSPLLGNESLTRAILRERWGPTFCNVVSKHDIMPRLLFAPISPLIPQLDRLLNFLHVSIRNNITSCSDLLEFEGVEADEVFGAVRGCLKLLVEDEVGDRRSEFSPFGSYLFCSEKGVVCVDNVDSVVKMMSLLLESASPDSSVDDHLRYGEYVEQVCMQFLMKKDFIGDGHQLLESSYDVGVALALESSGLADQGLVSIHAKSCLKAARKMGRKPTLNCANLAVKLAKVTPHRAEIEWYKAQRDASDEQMGYYDSFKRRETSKRDSRINVNRIYLGIFWDGVIQKLEKNEFPHDFHRRRKWVNASHFYSLLFEPLDIAEYYREGKHRAKGHYVTHGRERRYEIFDRWWIEAHKEKNNKRSRFASLTQDTCFWAKVEEARDYTNSIRREIDMVKRAVLWESINEFEKYATSLIERKEVSIDVLAKNSSYSQWVEEWKELKSHVLRFPHKLPPSFVGGEVVP